MTCVSLLFLVSDSVLSVFIHEQLWSYVISALTEKANQNLHSGRNKSIYIYFQNSTSLTLWIDSRCQSFQSSLHKRLRLITIERVHLAMILVIQIQMKWSKQKKDECVTFELDTSMIFACDREPELWYYWQLWWLCFRLKIASCVYDNESVNSVQISLHTDLHENHTDSHIINMIDR